MAVVGQAELEILPELSKFAGDVKSKVGEAFKNPTVVAGAAIAAVTGTVTAFAKVSVDKFQQVGGEVKQLTSATGGSVQSMSRLRFAAEETGVSTDSLGTGLKKLGLNVVNNGAQFDKLGIKVKDSRGQLLPMDQTLGNVANKFKTMPNGVEKNALAIQLFGKQGTDLIPILNKGKDGLSELGAEADKFGLTLTQGNLDAIKRNAAAHRELQAAMDGLKVQVGAALMPVLADFAEFMTSKAVPAITEITGLIKDKFGPAVETATSAAKAGFDAFVAAFNAGDGDITSSGLNGVLEALGNTARQVFDDARIAWGSFTDGFKSNDAVGAEVGPLATTFAAVGVAVRDTLAALKDIVNFLLEHQKAVKDVTLAVLGLKTAYEGWQLGKKTIDFAVSGVDKVMGVIDSISGALGKVGSKTIDIAAKATGGAASGAGNAAGGALGDQAGNIVSGAAGGALGNFFDLKALLPKLKIFAGGIVTSLAGYLIAGAGALESVGSAIAAVVFAPEALIAAVVAAVGLIAFHFRKGIVNFFANTLPGIVSDGVKGAPDFLSTLADKGRDLLTGLLNGVKDAAVAVFDWFLHLPDLIFYAIGYVGGTLFVIGRDLIQGLWEGGKFVFELVKGWVSDIPNVVTSLLNVLDTLYQKGQDLVQGLWNGVKDLFVGSVWPWFSALPGEVIGAIGDVGHTLWQIGSDIIGGLWSAVQLAWHDPKQFFIDLALAVPAAVGGAGRWLYQHGKDIIQGLKEGIENLYDSAISKFRDLRGNVLGAVSGAASWLIEAGKDVIKGLLSGIGSLYDSAVGKMRSLGGDIIKGFNDAIGRKSPSREFHNAAADIMKGLANGIDAHRHLPINAINDVAAAMLDPFSGQQLGGPTLMGRGGGGRMISIGQLTIQNNKTLQENLDEIDRLTPLVPA